MVDHQLAIRSFHTRLALTGLREEAPTLGREVTRSVRELLPSAIARALEPLLDGDDGVLRIDRVALRLRLGRGDLAAARLAELIARELAQQIAEHSGGRAPHSSAGIAYWPNPTRYAAAYLAHRLRLAPGPEWAFTSFQPLSHIAAHQAALELITAHPALLPELSRLIGVSAIPRLIAGLPEPSARELLLRLQQPLGAELPANAEAELAAALRVLPSAVLDTPGRAGLGVAATLLAEHPQADVERVRRTARLARVAVALAVLRAAASGSEPTLGPGDLTSRALVHLPERARAVVHDALGATLASARGRQALARLLALSAGRATSTATAALRTKATTPGAVSSRHAGIGLLMPTALAHRLPERLSAVALHRVLTAVLGDVEHERALHHDPLLAALAPFDPSAPAPTFPPVPERLRALESAATNTERAEPALPLQEGAPGWASCLLHAFAASLPGLEASSLPYLRRQFLERPGTLHLGDRRLTLVLDPLPLGILLRISGVHGWSGRLPHVTDALLRIEVRES
jgi:hypothetical protein